MKFFELKCFLVVYVVMLKLQRQYWVLGEAQVPCFFIFGDSLSDNGNNNDLATLAKANYKPYGTDFPKGPTGRFTNGRNIADFIAKSLGFGNYIPPFRIIKDKKGAKILEGANYASGGAGIRNETGQAQGQVICLDQQLKNHNYTISKIKSLLGNNESATTTHLQSCLYMVGMGSNDYLNNYFLSSPYTTNLQFSPQDYAIALTQQLSSQLKTLYGQGGRKFAVFGVGMLGCTPYVRARFDSQGSPCVEKVNDAVQLFNNGLKSLVQDLNANFTDATSIFIDIFQMSIRDAPTQGQIVSNASCCEVDSRKVQCDPSGSVCANRTEYIYWDGVHPTDAALAILAKRSLMAQRPNDTYPFGITQLAQLRLT